MNHHLYKTVLKNQVTTIENTGIYDHKNTKTKQWNLLLDMLWDRER